MSTPKPSKQSKQPKQPVDPKEFASFLQGLQLQTLRVRHLKVDAERDFSHGDMKNVRHREEYGFAMTNEGQARIDARHEVQLTGPRGKKLGSMAATFSWYYHSETVLTEEIFEIFAPMVRFQTWPHLREIVQSVSTRANWPRLTLPLLVAPGPNDQ